MSALGGLIASQLLWCCNGIALGILGMRRTPSCFRTTGVGVPSGALVLGNYRWVPVAREEGRAPLAVPAGPGLVPASLSLRPPVPAAGRAPCHGLGCRGAARGHGGGGGLARPGVAPRAARPSRGRFRARRRRRGRAPGPRAPAGGGAAAQCGRSQRAPPLSSLPSRDIGERAGLPRRHVPRAAPEAASGAADVAPPPTPLPPAARPAPPLRAARLRKWSCCAALRLRRAARAEGD